MSPSRPFSRRKLLQSGVALTAAATLPKSYADLSIGGQTVSQSSIMADPILEGTINQQSGNQQSGEIATWTEPNVPLFDFATIKANCEAIKDRGVPVHLLAPSGFGSDEQRNLLAIHRLTQAGCYIDNPEVINRRYLRFAGSDSERLGDITALIDQPISKLPKILLGVRGGYGAMRLLNKLSNAQWQTLTTKLKQRGTLLIGFSDFTAVQLAMFAQGGLPYVAGAMLGSDFGKTVVNTDTIQSFVSLCTQDSLTIHVPDSQQYGVKPRIKGTLWGGNLSVLSAMVGSVYMPTVPNGILFLEDTGEQPYRIERMLHTLLLSGTLDKQRAIMLGKFNFNGISDAYDGEYTFDTVIRTLQQTTGLPIYTEFPFGHVARRINFPLGVPITLEAGHSGYQATFNQFYNLRNEKNFANLDFSKLYI